MPRPKSMRAVQDETAALIGVPPETVTRDRLVFRHADLRTTVVIVKDHADRTRFGWLAQTHDARYATPAQARNLPSAFGIGLVHPVPAGRPAPPHGIARCYTWPLGGEPLEQEARAAFTTHGRAALAFVRDRRDLAWLLLADTPVRRGTLRTNTERRSEPERLAAALLLARDLEDAALQQAAIAKLAARGDEEEFGYVYRFRHAVGSWLFRYAEAIGEDVGELGRLVDGLEGEEAEGEEPEGESR